MPDGRAHRSGPLSGLLMDVYQRLYAFHGPQHWWPGDGPFEVIAGAILTQSAAWTNVEKALARMKEAGCWSFRAVAAASQDELAEIVRPSGYFNAKARKLKAFASHLADRHQGSLDSLFSQDTAPLRDELLSIHGIGEETADDIVVYAAGKPSFVIDSYTRRIVDRMGLAPAGANAGYAGYQTLFHDNLASDPGLFNEYHALLDRHAKDPCSKRVPKCGGCALQDLCDTGRQWDAAIAQSS